MTRLSTLSRDISPPPRRQASKANISKADASHHDDESGEKSARPTGDAATSLNGPALAAIEAGKAQIRDHLEFFSQRFAAAIRPASIPRLGIKDFKALYERNQHTHGHHFVIHQHDHPIPGTYDERIPFPAISPLTQKNNLMETASHSTGSLLIWDTGEYEVLPWKEDKSYSTDDEWSDDESNNHFLSLAQNERLISSFERRRIRLRLQGARLPHNYTISMWLPSSNYRSRQPRKPKRKRRRMDKTPSNKADAVTSSDSENENEDARDATTSSAVDEGAAAAASDDDEDTSIRENNAYPGAENTIGSVHQRNWMLTLDKRNSGFRRERSGSDQGRWIGSWEPFSVLGRDHERSVVTDRNADQVMEDEGVDRFVGRKMWRPILE